MTTHNIKVVLFASLIVAMVLPFSMMDNVAASEKDLMTLENQNEIHFEKFLKMAKEQQKTEQKLEYAKHSHDTKLVAELQNKIDNMQERMNSIQKEYIDFVSITDEEKQELEEQGLKIFNKLSDPKSNLYLGVAPDGYFVSPISKNTHLIFEGTLGTSITVNSALGKIQSNDNKGEFEGMSYTIGDIKKASHSINCQSRTTDCNYLMGGLAVKQGSETSTLSFWAKQNDGDVGFVMTAHGANGQGNTIDQYPTRDVGTVDTITGEAWGDCDCAFVDATQTVVKKVYKSSFSDQ